MILFIYLDFLHLSVLYFSMNFHAATVVIVNTFLWSHIFCLIVVIFS